MQLNRRRLLGGVAAAALTSGVAHSQALTASGKLLTSGGLALTKPPVPVPTGGTLLASLVTLTNPAGQPTQTNPFITFGHPIARSEYPNSGYKLALYDSTGTTKITDLQVDQTAAGWKPDNSINHAVVSGYATGTTLAAGQTATFMLKAISGTPSTAPVCTLSTLAQNSDLKAKCAIGPDTYTVSVNTIIASTPAASYPQTYIRQWKSGPYACEWCFGGFLKRDSDGAYHRWAFLKLYVTALSASGPFIVRGYLEQVQTYGANPTGTVGEVTTNWPQVIVDSIDVYNGATHICALGGISDLNNGTFGPSGVDLVKGEISASFAGGLTAGGALTTGRNPIGFVSTGTLPAGLGPASTTTYWALVDGNTGNVIPCLSRNVATRLYHGEYVIIATPAAGRAISTGWCIFSNGGIYACTTAGTFTGAMPTGTVFADNSSGGTLVWTLVTAQITSQGTGTHTMVMKSAIWGGSKAPMMGPDTYPYWNGAGSLPKLLVGYDRNYVCGKTHCVPPLDPAITPTAWVGALPRYVQNMTYLPGLTDIYVLGAVAESNVDERINMFSPTAFASICLPADAGMAMSCRLMALSWVDRNVSWRDERTQEISVCNYGPDRLGGSYPGMPPNNPTLRIGQGQTGSPQTTYLGVWTGYGGDIFVSAPPDPSHSPNTAYWPALTSGDPLFYDALLETANFMFSNPNGGGSVGTAVFGGKHLSWAWTLYQQTRGAAHQLQIFSQAEWICPDAHPAKAYFSDVMDDTSQIGLLWANANIGPNGQSIGFMPFAIPSGALWQGEETWMMSYQQIALMGEVLKDNRPGFRQFMSTYYWKALIPLWDSDVGGSERVIDAQWDVVGNVTGVNPPPYPPTEAQFLLTAADRNAGNPLVFKAFATMPPPQPLFIEGLASDGGTIYAYHNPGLNGAAFPASAYGLSARALCQMGKMAGIPQYAKIADRIEALLALSYQGNPCNWTLQGQAGKGTDPGNNNGLMYAMKAQ